MASSASLEVFNVEIEGIDDYKEHFDLHCTANQVAEGCRKALFLTRIGRDAFLKLKTLVSTTPLNDLSLEQIITTMRQLTLQERHCRNSRAIQVFQACTTR